MTSTISHTTHKIMTNQELTLDQLQAISGGGRAERQARQDRRKAFREEKRACREQRSLEREREREYHRTGTYPYPPEECMPVENQ